MLPRKILKFTTSETASETTLTNKNDKIIIVGNIQGETWPAEGGGNPLVPQPLTKLLHLMHPFCYCVTTMYVHKNACT